MGGRADRRCSSRWSPPADLTAGLGASTWPRAWPRSAPGRPARRSSAATCRRRRRASLIVSVTALGDLDGRAAGAALGRPGRRRRRGRRQPRAGRRPGWPLLRAAGRPIAGAGGLRGRTTGGRRPTYAAGPRPAAAAGRDRDDRRQRRAARATRAGSRGPAGSASTSTRRCCAADVGGRWRRARRRAGGRASACSPAARSTRCWRCFPRRHRAARPGWRADRRGCVAGAGVTVGRRPAGARRRLGPLRRLSTGSGPAPSPAGVAAHAPRAARVAGAGTRRSRPPRGRSASVCRSVERGQRLTLPALRHEVQTLSRFGVTPRADQRLDALDVGVPATLGAAVRVRDVVTEARSLAADVAVGSHG